ncbi:MAG: HAMP domain-containing histidine kinase [Candidatus Nealsonbacteria bacterium]|nr:HAMP domain-containing histidine kinase [Candidatus Nealsonbacteria bacterium]
MPDNLTTEKPKVAEAVSIVAHQLKNPISILKGYLEVLMSEDLGQLNEKQKEYLGDAVENLKRMAKTVNYLLDISRIEEGKYLLKQERFSLADLTRTIIKDLSFWAQASNSEIILEAEENLPEALADSLKIREVIENLISNALKYRDPGPGRITVFLKKKGKFLLFACQDRGIDIPKDDLKKVFSKFYRSEKAVEMDPSGTGLGLHINKAIVELTGGKIWFEQKKGEGIIFYFTIPHV